MVIKRGAGGLPGFQFEKAQQPSNNFYTIVDMDPQVCAHPFTKSLFDTPFTSSPRPCLQVALFDQVHVQDELHAVNGRKIDDLLPEEVFF